MPPAAATASTSPAMPALFDEMTELAGADIALLPIGGWGPSVGKLGSRTAARAAAMIRARVVIPIHWGTMLAQTSPPPPRPPRSSGRGVPRPHGRRSPRIRRSAS